MAVTGGTITDDIATSGASGGGVYVAGGAVTLDATTIVRKNSAVIGGGLSVAGGTLTATGTVIGGTTGEPYD